MPNSATHCRRDGRGDQARAEMPDQVRDRVPERLRDQGGGCRGPGVRQRRGEAVFQGRPEQVRQ